MASRTRRAEIARETLTILERGGYPGPTGREVSIRAPLDAARSGSVLYTPEGFDEVLRRRDALLRGRADHPPVAFEVANETTLHAARRLLGEDPGARVLALNFASARNPGGGFLGGSQAQEESLARASGLYACIDPLQADVRGQPPLPHLPLHRPHDLLPRRAGVPRRRGPPAGPAVSRLLRDRPGRQRRVWSAPGSRATRPGSRR